MVEKPDVHADPWTLSKSWLFFHYSFGMAHSFVDSIGDVDVISDAEVNNE